MTRDERRACPIFLASSHRLKAERERFDAIVQAVAPRFARHLNLYPVRWEKKAYGVSPRAIVNGSIQESVRFEDSEVVVVIVDGFVGPGTRGEFDDALRLFFLHRRPKLLVYIREHDPQPPDVVAFREAAFESGVVPSPYASVDELAEKLASHLTGALEDRHAPADSPPTRLRHRFLAAAVVNVVLAVVVTALCRTVRPPDGDNFGTLSVLAILAAPLLLGLTGWLTNWSYGRLLSRLRVLWRSPEWTEAAGYEPFRGLVPRWALPQPTSNRLPKVGLIPGLALAIALLGGTVAQYNCLFEQFQRWEFAVGWEVVEDPPGRPVIAADGTVTQRFVDQRRDRWKFGLQNPDVVRALAAEASRGERTIVYVHGRGRFAPAGTQPAFRRNLGPEVHLPSWPLVYLGIMIGTAWMGVRTLMRLAMFKREILGITTPPDQAGSTE